MIENFIQWKMFRVLVFIIFQIVACSSRQQFYDFDVKGNAIHGYYMTSSIGTPPQPINLLIDTGSSNLAVTVALQKGINPRYFSYNESLTFRHSNTFIKLRYVQGYWDGFIGLDIFNPCLKQDCSVMCNISCMYSNEDIFDENSNYQGILGLAYSSISVPNSSVRPFLDVFFEAKNTVKIFSLFLCGPFFSSAEQSSSCGKLQVGHFDEDNIDSDIMYTPIINEMFYEITVVDIKVNDKSAPVDCIDFNRNRSIIDSGTTNLNVPANVYSWVLKELKHQVDISIANNFWPNETVVCTRSNSIDLSLLPSLSVSLHHTQNKFFTLHISPELYMLPLPNTSCAMSAIGVSDYGVMIGASILRGFYVVFDRENKRIGFAKPKLHNVQFISDVSKIEIHSNDFDHCIRRKILANSEFPTGLGLLLICLIFISLCVLLPLLAWLWKFYIKRSNKDKSDVINLVDDDEVT